MNDHKCDDCFDIATHVVSRPDHPSWIDEYYCDECVGWFTRIGGLTVTPLSDSKPSKGYMSLLPADGNFTEEDLWEAIAEANGLDASEIMDGDLVEWL